jgi:hypothetical protein
MRRLSQGGARKPGNTADPEVCNKGGVKSHRNRKFFGYFFSKK